MELFSPSAWDQSDKFVKVYLTGLEGVDEAEDRIVKEFDAKSVEVKVPDLSGKNPVFAVKELYSKIDPEKSYVKVKSGEEGACDSFGWKGSQSSSP